MAPLRFRGFRANGIALFSFLVLVLALAEAHECAHITMARALCGGWGVRNFSVWAACEGCAQRQPLVVLATFAGPVFTFIAVWLGAWILLRSRSEEARGLGMALIFAALPFARIFTAITGHGDEVSGFASVLQSHGPGWATGLGVVLLLLCYPLTPAYRNLARKRRLVVFCSLLLVPMLLHGVVVHGAMNRLLDAGVLNAQGWLGSAVLINLWQVVVFAGAALLGRRSGDLFAAG